ncbi:MAG: hypothetical protein OCD76_05755 [Reichenbachiella sp.]
MKLKRMMIITVAVISVLLIGLYFMAEKNIHVKKELVIDKDIRAVWEVMGTQYTQVHLWSTNFKESKAGGNPKLPGLDYLHRITLTNRGETIQELDELDGENYSLTYHISKGAPAIAKSAVGIWSLAPVEPNKTRVIIEFKLETNGLKGLMLSSIIKLKLGKSAMEIGEELKFYMENGEPHPRKVESQQKLKAK